MTEINGIKHNVHEHCGKEVVRVQADIDRNIYDYFFRHVIPYSHGSRQAIVTFFFQRFYEECVRLGIDKRWDETNDRKIIDILNRLNFNESVKTKKERPNKVLRQKV